MIERLHVDVNRKYYHFLRKMRTFFLFLISRVITMPENLAASFVIVKRMITYFAPWELVDGTIYTFGLEKNDFIVLAFAFILLYCVSRIQENGEHMREKIADLPLVLRWAIYFAAIFGVLIFGTYGIGYSASSFVYMNY